MTTQAFFERSIRSEFRWIFEIWLVRSFGNLSIFSKNSRSNRSKRSESMSKLLQSIHWCNSWIFAKCWSKNWPFETPIFPKVDVRGISGRIHWRFFRRSGWRTQSSQNASGQISFHSSSQIWKKQLLPKMFLNKPSLYDSPCNSLSIQNNKND